MFEFCPFFSDFNQVKKIEGQNQKVGIKGEN
jgi:hypothetical protein